MTDGFILRTVIQCLDHLVNGILAIICIIGFLMCGYSLYDNMLIYNGANTTDLLKYKPTDEINNISSYIPNAVAWITINETNIDYPVMQGNSNDEYLNKSPLGEYSLSGSIFLDSRNDNLFRDDYSLIYGHHMEHNLMFGSLDLYKDKEYFDTHKNGSMMIINKKQKLTLFAYLKTDADDEILFNPAGRTKEEVLEEIKEKATLYEDPTEAGQVVGLSTCGAAGTLDRTMVFGILEK